MTATIVDKYKLFYHNNTSNFSLYVSANKTDEDEDEDDDLVKNVSGVYILDCNNETLKYMN